MSIVLLCATATEAERYPGFEPHLVGDVQGLDGMPISAAFATVEATRHPNYVITAAAAVRSVVRLIGATGAIPHVFMAGGGELPADLVRVA